MPATPTARFAVLVPVKPPAFAKSRLRDLGDDARRDLATAFAVDTVTAAAACPLVDRVLVVTDDHELARGLAELGVDVIPDGTSDDLNGTLALAAAEMHRRRPGPAARRALRRPARPAPGGARRRTGRGRPTDVMAFVADADGIGTTAVVAPSLDLFRPAFGPASRQRHLDAGRARGRRGRRTDAAAGRGRPRRPGRGAAARRRPEHVAGHHGAADSRVGAMQGTVSAYDADTHSGRVLLDDGVELAFPASALDGSRLRLLRSGQRVRLETTGSGGSLRVVGLQILTLS